MIPPQFLIEALDDDSDGNEDAGVFDGLAESVSGDVDSMIGEDATVGVALRTMAADIFLLSTLYRRRGIADAANPWAKQEADMKKKLDAIAKGEERIEPVPAPSGGTTRLIAERAKTYPQSGRLIL